MKLFVLFQFGFDIVAIFMIGLLCWYVGREEVKRHSVSARNTMHNNTQREATR